jgi:hypothetical protein
VKKDYEDNQKAQQGEISIPRYETEKGERKKGAEALRN